MADEAFAPLSSSLEMAALRSILEGTAQATSDEFFQTLVQHHARAIGVRYSLIAEFVSENRVRTLAYWQAGRQTRPKC